MKHLLFTIGLLLLTLPALAAESVYDKPQCEFTMTFPGEPHDSMRCNPENPEECQTLTTYTRVFDMGTSMNFKVSCNPLQDDMHTRYSGDVMKTTLTALARSHKVKEHQTYFKEYPHSRQAVIIGAGKAGISDTLYMGQMWIGEQSIMVVEGEFIGAPVEEYEAEFAKTLSSVRHKSWVAEPGNTDDLDKQDTSDGDSPSDKDIDKDIEE